VAKRTCPGRTSSRGIGEFERRRQGHQRAIAIRHQADLMWAGPDPAQAANDAEGRPAPLARDAARDKVGRAVFRSHARDPGIRNPPPTQHRGDLLARHARGIEQFDDFKNLT
jgi:hypothetical protein